MLVQCVNNWESLVRGFKRVAGEGRHSVGRVGGRLKALLDPYFPVDSLPRPEAVALPWEDAELRGICQ